MRSSVYALCFTLVAVPSLYSLVGLPLALLQVQVPFPSWFIPLYSFGSLVPPMLSSIVPRSIEIVIGYGLAILAIRRIWLFCVNRERAPATFVGLPKTLGYIGFWSFCIGATLLLLAALLRAGSGVPGAMVMIPAVICVPWAFFLTEIATFRRGVAPGS